MNQHDYNRPIRHYTYKTHVCPVHQPQHNWDWLMTTRHAIVGMRGHVAARPNRLSRMTELDVTKSD